MTNVNAPLPRRASEKEIDDALNAVALAYRNLSETFLERTENFQVPESDLARWQAERARLAAAIEAFDAADKDQPGVGL